MSTHLVIPDAHAHPDFNNDRFEWLGELIAEIKPDHVIGIGDYADMPSLCSYDMGTKGYEGRRYVKDIEVTLDAQERMFSPIKARKKRMPQFHMFIGNHEHRIDRAISSDAAKLEGMISLDDLKYEEFGWDVTGYKGATPGIKEIDGVAYAHFFTSGVAGRPIGGVSPAYQLITKQYQSCTQGHGHTLDFCVRTNAGGNDLYGCTVGCYVDYFADFAGAANDMWWRGVVVKRGVDKGAYDAEFISLDRIKREYS